MAGVIAFQVLLVLNIQLVKVHQVQHLRTQQQTGVENVTKEGWRHGAPGAAGSSAGQSPPRAAPADTGSHRHNSQQMFRMQEGIVG
jgi:hypothetical protein